MRYFLREAWRRFLPRRLLMNRAFWPDCFFCQALGFWT
jgi:hypothetical protein